MSDFFFFSSRRRHTRCGRDWSSDVCSSDLDDRPHDHRPQHLAAALLPGEAGARDRGPGEGAGLMVDSPLPALRREYEQIVRQLDQVTAGAERDAVKRQSIAYFQQVDALISGLTAR